MDKRTTTPSESALADALELSNELLRELERGELPLANLALKTARLARLLHDHDHLEIMTYESGGYPNPLDPEAWRLAGLAGRHYHATDPYDRSTPKAIKQFAYVDSIAELEDARVLAERRLAVAGDRATTDSSTATSTWGQASNSWERQTLHQQAETATKRLAARKAFIYRYVLEKNYQLRFSDAADDVFTRVRLLVDNRIGAAVPDSVKRFASIYDNLRSSNAEDWSNAAHSCRRVLQDLADAVFPPADDRILPGGKRIKLGTDQYVNRIMAFVEDHATSERFNEIVGSHLSYLGERLDALFHAAQKGSHSTISREEAERCLVYTYLIVGDVLVLLPS